MVTSHSYNGSWLLLFTELQSLVGHVFAEYAHSSELEPQHFFNWAGGSEVQVMLSYTESLRPAWAT